MINIDKLNAQLEQLSNIQVALELQKKILNSIISDSKSNISEEHKNTLSQFENKLNGVFEKVKKQDSSYIQDFENLKQEFYNKTNK